MSKAPCSIRQCEPDSSPNYYYFSLTIKLTISSVSTALPTLGRVFNDASIESWVGTSYLLTSTACQPLYGRISDIFGRKLVLLGSMLFFLIGSILCAVSQSMVMLIVFREYLFYLFVFPIYLTKCIKE